MHCFEQKCAKLQHKMLYKTFLSPINYLWRVDDIPIIKKVYK